DAAMGEAKALNRRAERSLVKAETLAALAGSACECDGSARDLESAWWSVLFNQFHDVLAGSSVPSAYDDSRDAVGGACAAADAASVRSIVSMARSVDTSGASGGVLFAMNHLPWARTAIV